MTTREVPTIEKVQEMLLAFYNSKVQRGTISLVSERYATVNFTDTFSIAPVINLTMRDPTNKVVVVTNVTVNSFSIDMGNTTTVEIDWVAIER